MPHPKRAITRDIRTRRPKRPGRQAAEVEAMTWPEGAIRVRDVMTYPAVTIGQGATVGQAWRLMRSRRIRHLPVLDDARTLVGIVTDRDLRQVILEPALQDQLGALPRTLDALTVREVMTWGVVVTTPETELAHVARIMRHQRIGALPVVSGTDIVGMLTAADLVQALVTMLDQGVVSKPERWGIEG